MLRLRRPPLKGDFDNPVVFTGALEEIEGFYGREERAPSNICPSDRSWFYATECDSWATRVSGPEKLIEKLEHDAELEVVRGERRTVG